MSVSGIPPSSRVMHQAIAYDRKLLVFGGDDHGLGFSDQMYVFDTIRNRWDAAPIKGNGPGERWGHGVFTYNKRLYSFAGYNGRYLTNQILSMEIPDCKVG
jgi:hypothetical protein